METNQPTDQKGSPPSPAARGSEKWFSYDPDNGFETHETEAKARANAEESLHWHKQEAADNGWDENVTQICWGKIIQEVVQTSLIRKPPPEKLDEDGYDEEGLNWSNCEEIADYDFSPNARTEPRRERDDANH